MARLEPYYADRVDMWCCGIMLLMMATRRNPPWQRADAARRPSENAFTVDDSIFEPATRGEIHARSSREGDPHFSDECWDLMQCLLWAVPLERPTAAEALDHPWFGGMPDDDGDVAL